QRGAAAVTDELQQAGGRVAAEGFYALARNNIEATLVAALGINDSRARRDRVQSAIGTAVQAEVRPSPHIDAVFVAGYQSLAMRQIRPYLRQNNADHLPTYMTSEGVDAERSANRDLEGMPLVEMPWHLHTAGDAGDLRPT